MSGLYYSKHHQRWRVTWNTHTGTRARYFRTKAEAESFVPTITDERPRLPHNGGRRFGIEPHTEDMLNDWAMLRDDRYDVETAAPRLGVSFTALDRALCRAKKRGDPRGSRVPFAHDMRQEEAA